MSNNYLLPSPNNPSHRVCLLEYNVPGLPNGGGDKGPNGLRVDSIPIANGIIAAGSACEIVHYRADAHDEFVAQCEDKGFDAFVVRTNPGSLAKAAVGRAQEKLDEFLCAQQACHEPPDGTGAATPLRHPHA